MSHLVEDPTCLLALQQVRKEPLGATKTRTQVQRMTLVRVDGCRPESGQTIEDRLGVRGVAPADMCPHSVAWDSSQPDDPTFGPIPRQPRQSEAGMLSQPRRCQKAWHARWWHDSKEEGYLTLIRSPPFGDVAQDSTASGAIAHGLHLQQLRGYQEVFRKQFMCLQDRGRPVKPGQVGVVWVAEVSFRLASHHLDGELVLGHPPVRLPLDCVAD